jgi:ABC-type antimicrobial peptide transport system permease subunit
MLLLSMLAIVALLLSALGLYGAMSYIVGQRVNEIGIRMALGAKPFEDVMRSVLAQAAKLALIGVAIGFTASIALTQLMTSLLYGVQWRDPLTCTLVAILLVTVAVSASYVPARRAMRVDPIVALRYE